MQNSPWVEQAIQEAWTEARKIVQQRRKAHELAKYADDPVGFCETTFGEFYTEDVKRVMLSVRDNPITVAKSGNSVGKTHGSARIALWFYLVYEDAKIYLTAAPPLENLRRLLWGEISILGKTIFIVGAIILIIYGTYISFLAFSYTIRVTPALSLTNFTPTEALVASLWEFLIKMFTNLFFL